MLFGRGFLRVNVEDQSAAIRQYRLVARRFLLYALVSSMSLSSPISKIDPRLRACCYAGRNLVRGRYIVFDVETLGAIQRSAICLSNANSLPCSYDARFREREGSGETGQSSLRCSLWNRTIGGAPN
jgi:hypothetical protein